MSSMGLFAPCQVEVGNSERVRGIKIMCSRCSAVSRIRFNTARGPDTDNSKADKIATRRFEEGGWHVASRPTKHLCPQCVAAAARAREWKGLSINQGTDMSIKPEPTLLAAPVSPPATPAIKAEPPREMTRDEGRLIYDKLNEVYESENTGYAADWTDKRVANDMGVPVGWVTKLREQWFGPEASNPVIDAQIVEARTLLDQARKLCAWQEEHEANGKNLIEQVTKMIRGMDEVAGRLAKIEKALRG